MRGTLSNRLLARLPAAACARFVAACETVELRAGEEPMRPAVRVTCAWFPLDTVLSVGFPEAGQHRSIEVAQVGAEGMVGIPLLLGASASELTARVVRPGMALRIEAQRLRRQLAASAALENCLGRYVLVYLAQLARAILCSRYHRVEGRLARLLLMRQDRCPGESLHVTQEFLAAALGVRRAAVTRAATDLQLQHLISYHRGVLTIVDRKGLLRAACACYAADLASYSTLLDGSPAGRPD